MALRVTRQYPFRCSACNRSVDLGKTMALSPIACPACATRQTVPARLGDLLLREKAGPVAAGQSFHGMDESLGRKVEILVLNPASGARAPLVNATVRVYRALAQLDHPYLQTIHRMLESDGHTILVTEPRTQSLGALTQSRNIHPAQLMNLAIQAAHGLEAAAAAGMSHMRLCPACFHLRSNLTVHVAGFSPWNHTPLAKPDAGWAALAPAPFLAPETRRGKRPDVRSDMYAFGVCMLFFLTRQAPEGTKTAPAILYGARDAMSRTWHRALSALLEPHPADRPESWTAVLALLKGRGGDTRLEATRESLEDSRERSSMAHRSLHVDDGKGPSGMLDGMMTANVEIDADEMLGQIWSIAGPEEAARAASDQLAGAKADSPVDILARAVVDGGVDMSNSAMRRAVRVGGIG